LASDHFTPINHEKGVHVFASDFASTLPGIHLNFLLVAVAAIVVVGVAGMLIGLPTLRLRGDYIAIVTLAFGEIVYRFALNGDQIEFASGYKLTNGRQAISPIDSIDLPGLKEFDSALNLRPYFWFVLALVALVLIVNFHLRDSRLGRAWIAIREDEVAAASMGVPLVKTKLMAYGTGAAFGGLAGAFLGSYLTSVNANNFQFGFSIFILAMVILGGLGSIWGVAFGAILLSFLNTYFIPNVFDTFPHKIGLDFDLTVLSFGIFGFLILIVMILRPQGLFPERRRALELTEGIGAGDATFEVKAP
jgi:branched-chain amino acid transport system permease protein